MKKLKLVLIYILLPFILIQFIPVDRENPPINIEDDLSAPPEVKAILKNSCYDCHSNETKWPFYSYIAPASWLISRDVQLGREDLNFSHWNRLTEEGKQIAKEEIIEEISRETMPMPIYLVMHPSARLSNKNKITIKNWATGRSVN